MITESNKYILITRPLHDSNIMLSQLNKLGCKAIIEPLVNIKVNQNCNNEINECHFDSIIVTSANAVRAINKVDKPIYCIGRDTFFEAKNKGFNKAVNIDGNIKDLKLFIQKNHAKNNGKLLYLSGDVVTDDLNMSEINLQRKIIYNSYASENLSKKCIEYIQNQQIEIIVFYSKRTAQTFNKLANNYNFTNIYAICISEKCSLALNKLNFKEIFVSKRPNGESMLELITNISFNLS